MHRMRWVVLAVFVMSTVTGCHKQAEPSGGSASAAMGSPRPAASPGSVGPAMVPRGRPMSIPAAGGDASDAAGKGLLGLWGLERVMVGGMSVPLPKHFRIRLHLLPRGRMVVLGVKRTKSTRSEGTWEVRGKRLVSTVEGKREVRSFELDGDRLTLTRTLLRRTVWHMKRLPPTKP